MKRVAGAFVLALGIIQLAWIGYNLFVNTLPAAKGRNPIVPILVSALFIYVGSKWIRNETA